MHEVVTGLVERGQGSCVPVGLIPAGTGNDVARQLGLDDPVDAARRILAGRTSPFDVAEVRTEGRTGYCVTIVGWAGVADINCLAERMRRLGSPRYAIAALCHILRARPSRAKLVLDDRVFDDDFLLVVACNTAYSGSGMQLAPRAAVNDGKLDVVVVRRASRRQMLRLFARVFEGSHVELPCVECYQVRSMEILADASGLLDLDGEIQGTTPVSVATLPGAVRMFG